MEVPAAENRNADTRLKISQAIIVEGRDDVDAVSRACDALIIPTHGFGINEQTWAIIDKAYEQLGIIILTDPDHAGEEIRRRLTDRYPRAIQCYMAREDTEKSGDIGIENAVAQDIRAALVKALELQGSAGRETAEDNAFREVTMRDLAELGLSGSEGASDVRRAVTRELGIGYCNARALITRLRGFRIGYGELLSAIERINTDKR